MGGMLNDTRGEYIFIRACIFFLQSIAPICSLVTVGNILCYITGSSAQRSTLWVVLQCYCAVEAVFFCFFLWYCRYLQRETIHPPLRSTEQRRELFNKTVSEINDINKFLSGWFRGARVEDIGRDDLKNFINFAIWEGRATAEHDEELEEYIQTVEKMLGGRIEKTKGTAKGLHLTLDPIDMEPRSLLWYSLISLVDSTSFIKMWHHGFQFSRTSFRQTFSFPLRPSLIFGSVIGLFAPPYFPVHKSPVKNISYWSKPHRSEKRLPVIYIHGIGIGLAPHVDFLHELDEKLNGNAELDDHVGIMAIETLAISTRLTHPILRKDEFLRQLKTVLHVQGWDRFVLLSHSYGSILTTNILSDPSLANRVSATLLVDPVSILLHMPDVAYNFTVRKPKKANEWQLYYFASKDPGIAHTLGRHFFWYENVLWRDQIMKLVDDGMKITASLSSRDLIVDTSSVAQYLIRDDIPDPVLKKDGPDGQQHMELKSHDQGKSEAWKHKRWEGKGLEIVWWDDLDHAQVFDVKETRAKLVDMLDAYSRNA